MIPVEVLAAAKSLYLRDEGVSAVVMAYLSSRYRIVPADPATAAFWIISLDAANNNRSRYRNLDVWEDKKRK